MYDIIFIGGGLNYAGAVTAAKNGLKTGLIEKSLQQLGGICLHKGCIPSKMFLHFANVIRQSKNSVFENKISLNMQKLIEKKKRIIQNATQAITRQSSKVDLIEGTGKIIAPHQVQVKEQILKAKHIVIGTGSSPFIPPGIEYNKQDIITSDEILELTHLPKSIAILGDGAIGLEMASFFASVGVVVTLISRHETVLHKAHPVIQASVKLQLEKMGITLLSNHHVLKAKSTYRGVHITFDDEHSRYFEMLVVATGRKPNTDVVGTDKIQTNRGIITDETFETTLTDHYAIGDCNGKLQLAHAARAEVLYVVEKILGHKPATLNLEHVVKFIHMLPMGYATVGKNKEILEKENTSFKEGIVPLSHFTLSHIHDASEGVVITYADDEGFILGAEILAPNAEELIATVAIALAGEMDKHLAQKTIMAHPTFSEALERSYFRL
jgi:dihydrolipoamide dehydrogenase